MPSKWARAALLFNIKLPIAPIIVATSFTAAPARADEDVFKVIAGLAVLGVLANEVNKSRDRKRERAAQASRKAHQPAPLYQNHRQANRIKRVNRAKVAPQRCVRERWTHRGTREVYGARCMQRFAKAQLPQTCLRQNQTNSGPRYFYAPRCLRQQGWRA